MKKNFLILMIFLISSCSGTQTQTDSRKSVDQNSPDLNSVRQNINNKTETIEDWDYCGNFSTRPEWENCLSDELKKLEEKLDVEYSNALESLREYHTQNDVENLILTQKIWQSYREANCQAQKDTYGEGTDAVGAGLQCRLRLTKERLSEVKNIYGKK